MFLSATVGLTSSKSCFASLSNDLIQRLPVFAKRTGNVMVFQIDWDGGKAYLSWSGGMALTRSDGFAQAQGPMLELGKKFADLNGIKMGQQVVVTPLENVPACTTVHVDPLSANDWEIMELHAGFIEANLLNQVRVVWSNQVVAVWINQSTSIVIKIGKHEPDTACVMLEEFTEVIVAPKQRQTESSNQQLSTTIQRGCNQNEVCQGSQQTRMLDGNFSTSLTSIWNYFFSREGIAVHDNCEFSSESRDNIDNNSSDTNGLQQLFCCKSIFAEKAIDLCLRSQSAFHPLDLNKKLELYAQQFSCVFVSPNSLGLRFLQCCRHHKKYCIDDVDGWCKTVTIRKLLSPKEKYELINTEKRKNSKEAESVQESSKKEIILKPVTVRMILCKNVLPGSIILHKQLQKQLGSGGISWFRITYSKCRPQTIQGLILHPLADGEKSGESSSKVIVDSFTKWVAMITSEECPFQIWNGMTVSFDCNGIMLEFILTVLSQVEHKSDDNNPPYYLLTPSVLQDLTVVVGEQKSLPKLTALLWQAQIDNAVQISCGINDLGGFSQPYDKCLKHLVVCLEKCLLSSHVSGGLTKGLSNGAVLICGSGRHAGEGCGKTSLGLAICNKLNQLPIGAHVVYIDCIPLRGKRVETVQRHWQQAFLEATWYQPSVILLDNLDHVISAPSLAQEMGGEGLYRLRLLQVFKDLITSEIVNQSKIAVMATSRSRDCLHGALQSSHGVHMFHCCVELGSLNEHQRCEVLMKLIEKSIPDTNYNELEILMKSVARKCEGFSPKDLNAIVKRALHFALIRNAHEHQQVSLVLDDLNQALAGYRPASLRGVQLHKPGHHSWLDVGGLHEVKKALEETLLWPSKYTGLFSKCPLRIRSGLLLYGPPGTGKTLLAGVIANESGLNFISIKGPELLSKYIGASEQAVRDVFSRAQTARPCILFFDEFDALAPRRGHDSTGVTDRVVNQLLTQLDGVEGLEGVFLLAATSRPGLIDPALLRPGRLDKCVYCPIPNESERLEILKALTRSISLEEDVHLKIIAERCQDFTGADIKALLYNAQLECIHRKTSKLKLYGSIYDDVHVEEDTKQVNEVKTAVITICQADLEKAVSMMKPSVSPNERLMYESMFDSFMRSRGNSFTRNTPIKGKATLA